MSAMNKTSMNKTTIFSILLGATVIAVVTQAARAQETPTEYQQVLKIVGKTGVSDNVGGVKHVATTLPHALEQERHFALIGEVLNPTKARFLISIQVGKLSSTHASLRSQARS